MTEKNAELPQTSAAIAGLSDVLARLNTPAAPDQAQTSLRLREAPIADTARYDRLRPTHLDHLNGQEINHA